MEMRVGAGNSHGLDALIRDLALVRIQAVPLCFYMSMVDEQTLNLWILVRVQVGALTSLLFFDKRRWVNEGRSTQPLA